MAEWRTMEDAPKDGTKIDLLYPHPRGRTIDCYWDAGKPWMGAWLRREPTWGEDHKLLPESEWETSHFPNMQPTHWRLAPELPASYRADKNGDRT